MIALGYVPEDAKKVVDFAPSMALVVGVLADGVVKIRLLRDFEPARLEGGKRTGSPTPVTTCTMYIVLVWGPESLRIAMC